MVVAVANDQRPDEDPLLLPAHDRVPERGGVIRALDAVPRFRRHTVVAGDPGFHELPLGGHGALTRIDEELAHEPRP